MTSEPTEITGQICSTPNCGKPLRVRGFCVACYYRNLRNGKFEAGSQTKKWKHRLTEIDAVNRTAYCSTCGPTKILKRSENSWRCGTDKMLHDRSRDYKKAYRESKLVMMESSCEICGATENLRWDHNHQTGEYRGTLCDSCNKAIGLMKDNSERLIKASEYVKR